VEKITVIQGITALNFIDFLGIYICITENNLFYLVPVSKKTSQMPINIQEYMEFDYDNYEINLGKKIDGEIQLNNQVKQKIAKEKNNFQVLSCALNSKEFESLMYANATIVSEMPKFREQCIRPNGTLKLNEIESYANILVYFKNNIEETLLQQSAWNLEIKTKTLNGETYSKSFRVRKELIKEHHLQIVLALPKGTIPKVEVHLCCVAANILVDIPIVVHLLNENINMPV
jgi:hypothetical protein